jgi:thiamine biosynthesis protein ThiS
MLKNKQIFINLNGKKFKIVTLKKVTIYHLIKFLGYKSNFIALEYNKKIVLKKDWKKVFLKTNTNIEIVTIVGGG